MLGTLFSSMVSLIVGSLAESQTRLPGKGLYEVSYLCLSVLSAGDKFVPRTLQGCGDPRTLFLKRVRGGPFFEKINTAMVRGATERRP